MENGVSTCVRTWRKKLKNWYKDAVFKPPSHGLRWRGLWVLQTTLLPNCCLTDGPFDVKKKSASFVGGRISGINYGLCDSWLTRPCWQCLTFAHCILQLKSLASQEDHLFSVILADPSTAEKHSSKIPCQGVKSHPVHSFRSWSLSMSEWPTVVWRGMCF